MTTARQTPSSQQQSVDGNSTNVGGGSVTPRYMETFGVNITGISAGSKINPGKWGAGSMTVMPHGTPGEAHPTQPSIGSRAGSS
jgi:hypothetical protein